MCVVHFRIDVLMRMCASVVSTLAKQFSMFNVTSEQRFALSPPV
jgi:hypothetical protein